MTELLPCPFCGGSPSEFRAMDESHHSHAEVEFLQINCQDCGASSVCSEHQDEVVAAWNSRAPASEPVERDEIGMPASKRREEHRWDWRGKLMCKLGIHFWHHTPATYIDAAAERLSIPSTEAVRTCRCCGKSQNEDRHCLGLNPPEYARTWRNA